MFDGGGLASWAVAMFQRYPWGMSGVLVMTVGALGAALIRLVGLWHRRHSKVRFRLRSAREQARFRPVSTVYQPKVFRGQRPPPAP